MAVKIRLTRTGAKNSPCFRVVVVDSKSPRDGACLEFLGWYDPKKKHDDSSLKMDRINYWISKGATPSDTVRSLIKKARNSAGKASSKASVEEVKQKEPAPAEPEPVAEAPEPEQVENSEPAATE